MGTPLVKGRLGSQTVTLSLQKATASAHHEDGVTAVAGVRRHFMTRSLSALVREHAVTWPIGM